MGHEPLFVQLGHRGLGRHVEFGDIAERPMGEVKSLQIPPTPFDVVESGYVSR